MRYSALKSITARVLVLGLLAPGPVVRPAMASVAPPAREVAGAAEADRIPASVCRVRYTSGRLSVDAVSTPLREVVKQVVARTGGTISWVGEPGDEAVSARFADLSLEEGLTRILSSRNFVAKVTPQSRELAHLWIGTAMGGRSSREFAPATAIAPKGEPPSGTPEDSGVRADAATQPPATIERVHEIITQEGAGGGQSLAQILESASDPEVRGAAMEGMAKLGLLPASALAVLASRGDDPRLKRQALMLLQDTARDDESAVALLEGVARGKAYSLQDGLTADTTVEGR